MLRIGVAKVRGTLVSLSGRLAGEEIEELEKTCRQIDGPIALDLSQLLSADGDGVAALRRILASGGELARASPYIELLLDSGTDTADA